jgi:hypothetical protein
MSLPGNHPRRTSCGRGSRPTRRRFLQVSTLTGAAAFCRLRWSQSAERAETLTIRGHHLFDMLDALGTGKTSHKTLGPVAIRVRANPRVSIKVVVGVDDICSPCEWWDHQKGRCKKSLDKYPQDNANSFTSDRNALSVLGLKAGQSMPAQDLYQLIRTRVTQKVFAEEVCVACRLVDKCKETYEPKIAAAVRALSDRKL